MNWLNKTTITTLFVLLGSWAQATQHENMVATVTAMNNSSARKVVLKVLNHPHVLMAQPVFSHSEKKALLKMNERALAESFLIKVRDERSLQEIQAYVKKKSIRVRVEKNSLPIYLSSEPLSHEQWGMNNRGKKQPLEFSRWDTKYISGVVREDIGLSGAPKEKMTSKPIVVAVLDTGVDVTHKELSSKIALRDSECKAVLEYDKCLKEGNRRACHKKYMAMDTDGNGYALDCHGWNTLAKMNKVTKVLGNNQVSDPNGHGTHVAGIIGAAKNGFGIAGVAQNVKILPVMVIDAAPTEPIRPQSTNSHDNDIVVGGAQDEDSKIPLPTEEGDGKGVGFADRIARGILYAIRTKADVINMSLGWPRAVDSQLMEKMVQLAQSQGIVVVAAAGNDSTDSLIMPCLYKGVVCVGAHSADGSISHFSNYGSGVDVTAPGHNILSTWPMGKRAIRYTDLEGFEFKNGTSMASPFVAGVMARLLNEGFSPQEAYARLILGARKPLAPSLVGSYIRKKFTLSGNVDLKRSLVDVKPQPLILPTEKKPTVVPWNRSKTTIKVQVPLKNFWKTAKSVRVQAELDSHHKLGIHQLKISRNNWSFTNWKENEVKTLSVDIHVNPKTLDSENLLNLTIQTDNQEYQFFQLQIEVVVPVDENLNDSQSVKIPILATDWSEEANLRSVTANAEKEWQDYVVIDPVKGEKKERLFLLKQDRNQGKYAAYQTVGSTTQEVINGSLLLINKVDINLDGNQDYVFVYLKRPKPGERASNLFVFYHGDMTPLEIPFTSGASHRYEFPNEVTVIPQDFTYVKTGDFLLPAWVGRGREPELDKPGFDPWNPDPEEIMDIRAYYVTLEGLRGVKPPEDMFFVSILKPTVEDEANHQARVLIAKGNDYVIEYQTAAMRDGELHDFHPVSMKKYRQLLGAPAKNVTSLSRKKQLNAQAYTVVTNNGGMRSSWLSSDENAMVADEKVFPKIKLDSVAWVSGSFLGETTKAVFAQSHYELQYHDLNTKDSVSRNLKRFSFFPGSLFVKIFYPVVTGQNDTASNEGDYTPGVYVPGNFGLSDSTQVYVPAYDQDGQMQGLFNPARFRLLAHGRCQAMGNPIAATPKKVTELVYYCGNHFLRIPLNN